MTDRDWKKYKRELRAKRREEGFVEVTVWARPEDKEQIRRYAASLEVAHHHGVKK